MNLFNAEDGDVVGVYFDSLQNVGRIILLKKCEKCGELYIHPDYEGTTVKKIKENFQCLECWSGDEPDVLTKGF